MMMMMMMMMMMQKKRRSKQFFPYPWITSVWIPVFFPSGTSATDQLEFSQWSQFSQKRLTRIATETRTEQGWWRPFSKHDQVYLTESLFKNHWISKVHRLDSNTKRRFFITLLPRVLNCMKRFGVVRLESGGILQRKRKEKKEQVTRKM